MARFDTLDMASGGLALVLEPHASWEQFTDYSEDWISRLNATVLVPPITSFDECLVEVRIGSGDFWITYDDFQAAIHLEAKELQYNSTILALQQQLRQGSQS